MDRGLYLEFAPKFVVISTTVAFAFPLVCKVLKPRRGRLYATAVFESVQMEPGESATSRRFAFFTQ